MVGIRSARPSADESTAPQAQTGAATVWAASGVVWTVVVVQAMVRWIGSDTEFAPAPVHGPDVIATANLVGLRIFEGLCAVVIVALVWFCAVCLAAVTLSAAERRGTAVARLRRGVRIRLPDGERRHQADPRIRLRPDLRSADAVGGQPVQFPIYKSLLVAALSLLFTWARLQAVQASDGLSPVERGYRRWPRVLWPAVRLFAVIGFCAAAIVCVYHLPLSWFNMMGESTADLPSYMLPG